MFGFEFSMNYALALQLVKGSNGFDAFAEENLHDPEIVALAERIFMNTDEEMPELVPEGAWRAGHDKIQRRQRRGRVNPQLLWFARQSDDGGRVGEQQKHHPHVDVRREIRGIIEAVHSLRSLRDMRSLGDLLRD